MTVVVGFGGNIGSDEQIVARFERAREALAQLGAARSASLYRTSPIVAEPAGAAQQAFLNSAVSIAIADATPAELISTVLEIERLAGRVRPSARWGPRAIDLDILVWDARVIRTPELEVPHPRIAERRFALEPLVELVGEDAVIPGRGRAGDLLARVAGQDCVRVGTW